jgi:hypothetical protein
MNLSPEKPGPSGQVFFWLFSGLSCAEYAIDLTDLLIELAIQHFNTSFLYLIPIWIDTKFEFLHLRLTPCKFVSVQFQWTSLWPPWNHHNSPGSIDRR